MPTSNDTQLTPATQSTAHGITQEGLNKLTSMGVRLRVAVIVLPALFALGIIGFVMKALDGFNNLASWSYYAAMFGYLLTTVMSAPVVAIGLRLTKAHWSKPLVRAAEMYSVVGILCLLWFLPLMALIPSIDGRHSLWIAHPIGAPHTWDMLVVLFLAICGLGLLYTSALPDLAAIRDHGSGFRQRFAARLSSFWRGTRVQWRILYAGMGLMGAFYLLLLLFGHTLLSTDLALSLIPGWKDSIFAPHHALSGLQAAVAVVIVTLFVLRKWGGYAEHIGLDQFWGLAKILLALCLLWMYFWFAALITFWYGRTPVEQNLLKYLMFESYRLPFLIAFSLNFVAPFALVLLWNPFRKSILGPTIAALMVLVGTLFDRIRIYVSAFAYDKETFGDPISAVPPAHLPGVADIFIIIGGIAGAILIYVLATRLIPVVSMYEMKEDLLLRRVRPFLRTKLTVLGKPE